MQVAATSALPFLLQVLTLPHLRRNLVAGQCSLPVLERQLHPDVEGPHACGCLRCWVWSGNGELLNGHIVQYARRHHWGGHCFIWRDQLCSAGRVPTAPVSDDRVNTSDDGVLLFCMACCLDDAGCSVHHRQAWACTILACLLAARLCLWPARIGAQGQRGHAAAGQHGFSLLAYLLWEGSLLLG